jgi:hypothetical protein
MLNSYLYQNCLNNIKTTYSNCVNGANSSYDARVNSAMAQYNAATSIAQEKYRNSVAACDDAYLQCLLGVETETDVERFLNNAGGPKLELEVAMCGKTHQQCLNKALSTLKTEQKAAADSLAVALNAAQTQREQDLNGCKLKSVEQQRMCGGRVKFEGGAIGEYYQYYPYDRPIRVGKDNFDQEYD